ncbi:hypothetical protein EV182_001713 [Spiromyces aspiralis]|uniref:Uncharacterized protein n=1 Tax=Spiromyces aspiralis TaxID=68401 RepID=A0ACC1I0E5_9FUNG|nr:hypothetical protein EV182_001713 [Spiromyces aspiralis]
MSTSPPVKRQSVPLRSPFLPSSPEPDGPMTADVWIGTRKRDWDSAFRIKHDEFEATLRDNEAWLDLYWESIQGLRCLNESDIMVSNALKTSSARRRGRPRTHVRDVFVDGAPGDCLSPPLLTNAISMSRSISATLGGRGLGVSDTLTSSQATLVNGGEAQGVALGRGSIGRYPAVLSRNNSAATKAFEAAKRFKQVHSEYEADQILRQIDRSRDNKDWLPAVVGGADGEGDNVGDDLAASPNEHRENGELLPRLQTADGLGCGGGVQRGRPAMLMFQQAGSEASVGQRSPARADLGVGEDGQKLRPISTLASQSPMATPRARPLTVSFSQDSAAGDGEQTRSPRSRFQATSPIPSLREFILNGGSRFSRAPASPSAALSPQSSATVASPSSAAGKDGNLTSLSRSSSKYIPDWADAFNRASTSRSGTPVAQLESISATLSSKGSIGPVSERPKISSPLVSGQGPSDEQESGFSEGMAAVVGASLDGPEIRNLESNITTEDAGAGSTLPASDGNKDELVVECPLARTKLPPEESEMSEQAGEVAESSPMPTSPNGGRRSSAEATTTAEDEEESVGSDDANNSEKDNHDIDETTHEEEDAAALDGAGRLSYAGELAKDGNESEDNELESDMEDLNKDLDDIQAAIGPPTPMPQRPASLLKASRQEPDSAGEDAYESDDTDSDDGGENQVVVGRESEVVAGPPKKQAGIQTTKTPAKLLPRKPSKKVMGTTTQIKPGSVAATRRMFEQANVAPITPRMKSPVPTMHGTGAKSLATPSNTQYQPQNAGSLQQQKQPSKRAPVVAATTTYASGSVSNTSVFKNISRVKLQMQTARNGNSTAPSASASTSVRHGALSRTNTASNSTLFKSIRKVPSRAETLEVTSSTAPHATSQQQPTLAVSKKGSVSSLKRSATAGETLSKVSSSSSLRSKVGDTGGKQRDADPTPRGASQQHQHQQQQQQQRTEPKVAGGNSGGSGLFSAVMSAIASPISWISSNTSQEHVSQDRAASRYALGTGEESPLASSWLLYKI